MLPFPASSRSWLRVAAASTLGLALCLFVFPEFLSLFLAVNLTPSLPRGLYRVTSLDVRRGALVTFCLPPDVVQRFGLAKWIAPGRCAGGKAPLCKRIEVVGPGQAACGKVVWQVPRGKVFVRGDSPNSQDSCIFGPVPVAWLRDGVVPVWTHP